MFGIKNYIQKYNYIDIPHTDYYTNNVIVVHKDILLNKYKLKYTPNVSYYKGLKTSMFNNIVNMQKFYRYLNIDNKLELHRSLIYTYDIQSTLTQSDYIYGVWYAICDGVIDAFSAEHVGFIVSRVYPSDRPDIQFYLHRADYNHCGIEKLPLLTLVQNNYIIGMVAGLYLESEDIPVYIKQDLA
jgi:hypothetical protein